ncbi:hypothetical protein ATO6_07685 [Oceanicola sp. 22II-s10i]|uniref:Zn-ribbon domain-containing OB-fold protein n=1 Tax=Oceanicola sp. 22II-s10i TaxID=1317116 RepID=UPI000B520FB0|nr:hypothetical protein [Oceanicola sp. 22II-s10i]OWU86648.1 hypothetical protein ATO6_07685 [Oceanicola sp. 22II-s10i]
MELEKPDLYRVAEDGASLVLRAGRCGTCGELNFPLSPFGCNACGAEPAKLVEEDMDGHAQLLTFITIHQKLSPKIDAPCVVGEARLANGRIQEIMLQGAGDRFADDMTVRAVPVEVTRGDKSVIACRFAPAEG